MGFLARLIEALTPEPEPEPQSLRWLIREEVEHAVRQQWIRDMERRLESDE